MKAKIFAIVLVLVAGALGWNQWSNSDPQHPDIPALRLSTAKQNVYPEPAGMVALNLYFENAVNAQEFANRVWGLKGVVKLYAVGKNKKVFTVLFDPGLTSQSQLLAGIYPLMDDPTLFR